jgi:hypothetical protein
MLCVPSLSVPKEAEKLLTRGISTVDSYDIHADIYDVGQRLDKAAKAGSAAMRKMLSKEKAGFCSGQNKAGAKRAARTVAGTKLSQRTSQGGSRRPESSSAGKILGRQVTTAMPQMLIKISD